MSTLSDLETDVKVIWKRDDETLTPKQAINQTYKAMLSSIGHHKLQDRVYKNLITGQYEVSMPTGILRIHHPIKLIDSDAVAGTTDAYPLDFVSKAIYDTYEPNPESGDSTSGAPRRYALWKNSILLTPVPDKEYALEINIGGEPVDLLEDADESILSSVWDETIVAGSLARLFASVKLYTDADHWRKVYLNGYEGDGLSLVGGLNLLRQLDRDNTSAPIIVENQPL